MVKERLILAAVCLLPLGVKLWLDRNGNAHKSTDTTIDVLIFLLSYIAIIFFATYKVTEPPLTIVWKVIVLAIGYRVMFFDYLINIILYRRHIIEWPNARFWWSYLGKTSRLDKKTWWNGMDWRIRLFIRVIIFSGCILLYIL